MRQADVIVIGAGVLGTFHAYHAALKGYKTLLIERNAYPDDASARNFGIIAPSIVPVGGEWAGFARASAEIYRTLQEEQDITVHETGSLYLASTALEREVLREFALLHGQDYTCAYLDAAEACDRYPFVRESYCAGALLFPRDLTLDPRCMLRRLIPHLEGQGLIEYAPRTTMVAARRSGEGCDVVDARGTRYRADRVVICSGADYRTLFPALFDSSGLRVCKLQMMRTAPQPYAVLPHAVLSGLSILRYPAFASCPSYASLRAQPADPYLRDHGVHLLFKALPDGAVVIGDSHQYSHVRDADLSEEATDSRVNAAILRYGQRMVMLPSWDIDALWNGYYLVHPEREVYVETVDQTIHIVTGIGGKGMTTGPGFAHAHIDTLLA